MQNDESIRKDLEASLPPIIPRHGIGKYGIPYSEGHMANCDSRGEGPVGAMTIGRKIVYRRSGLIEWLLARMTEKPAKPVRGAR